MVTTHLGSPLVEDDSGTYIKDIIENLIVILELLHLGKDLIPNPERAFHPFPAEDHGLGFGGADSYNILQEEGQYLSDACSIQFFIHKTQNHNSQFIQFRVTGQALSILQLS